MEYFENSTVIVPFDFSDLAKSAVEQTIEWVDEATTIHVVHVVESSLLVSLDMAAPMPPLYDHEQQQFLLAKLKEMYSGDPYHQVKVHCIVGDPGHEIAELADQENAKLIVMPSHGRTGISRLLLGSVAERVLRLSKCPVLVLRDDSAHTASTDPEATSPRAS